MGIIKRLLTETDPITYEGSWFTLREATCHLRPYTKPHFPMAVAAAQSPSGMVLAGKYGLGVLSVSVVRGGSYARDLKDFWKIAEETAERYGNAVDRNEWRLVTIAFLADSRKEALEQARVGAGRFQREYFEQTLGADATDCPQDKIVDLMVERGAWCVGTPDDMIQRIHDLDESTGGFGGLLVQATEFGTREQVLRSYELMSRYVMPHFQRLHRQPEPLAGVVARDQGRPGRAANGARWRGRRRITTPSAGLNGLAPPGIARRGKEGRSAWLCKQSGKRSRRRRSRRRRFMEKKTANTCGRCTHTT